MSECISHTTMHACHPPPLASSSTPRRAHLATSLLRRSHTPSPSPAACVQNSRRRPSRSCPGGLGQPTGLPAPPPHRPTAPLPHNPAADWTDGFASQAAGRTERGVTAADDAEHEGLHCMPAGSPGSVCITVCRRGGRSGLDRRDGQPHVSKPVSADSRNPPLCQRQHQHQPQTLRRQQPLSKSAPTGSCNREHRGATTSSSSCSSSSSARMPSDSAPSRCALPSVCVLPAWEPSDALHLLIPDRIPGAGAPGPGRCPSPA